MTSPMDDIARMVFKRSDHVDAGEFSLDAQTLTTLIALDGKTPLEIVARKLNMDMGTMRQIMTRLAKMKLVVRVAKPQVVLPSTFVTLLKSELSKATGPIAGALLDDVLGDMGFEPSRIPKDRAPELVEILAQEITDEQRRVGFIKVMLAKLQ